jgi:hypothetical protein
VLLYLSVSRGTDDLEINRWGGLSGLCIVDIYLWSIYHRVTGIHHRNAGADTNIVGHGLVRTSGIPASSLAYHTPFGEHKSLP